MSEKNKVMLITGSAKRIGAYLAKAAHNDGYNIVLHYRQSKAQTQELHQHLNSIRNDSCMLIQADFNLDNNYRELVGLIEKKFKRLDVLINNASEYFSTKLDALTASDYDRLFNSNVKGPLFLSQACYPLLKKSNGNIVNIVDIHADKPLKNYPVYSMAKAANKMMVKALAKEMSPDVRVNGISPGCIIWPEKEISENEKQSILNRTSLKKHGSEENIYQVIKLLQKNKFMTGEIIKVDGGRSLNM
jgi:pteridine reductase